MNESDGDNPRGKAGAAFPGARMFASGGLSFEDFRQDAWVRHLESTAQSTELPTGSTNLNRLERQARWRFRSHLRDEQKHGDLCDAQMVVDLNGSPGGPRDVNNKPASNPFPCDGAELFGQIRTTITRHPPRRSSNRRTDPLRRLLERIVDEGLAREFLADLSAAAKDRAMRDPELVRLVGLIFSEAGFDRAALEPLGNVLDDDEILGVTDSKRVAELLTEYGCPSTARDVENCKKRLNRFLRDVGEQMFSRLSQVQAMRSTRAKE